MGMRPSRVIALAALLLGCSAAVVSCLDATQITLEVRTDLRCDQVRGLTIAGGAPGATENAAPATETARCLPTGEIGTLVVTPDKSKSSAVAFKVVMGVDVPVSQCTAANGYKGCVVQRRQLSYVPHTPLTVPVYMLFACIGVPCDESTTCAANGQCVSAKIDNAEGCVGGGCFPPGDPSGGPDAAPPAPPADGAARTDAAPPEDASGDAPAPDGAPDAAPDGPGGGGDPLCPTQGGGLVSCNGAQGQVCCANFIGPFEAACLSGQQCSLNSRSSLFCTSQTDCDGGACCALGSRQMFGNAVCQASCDPDGGQLVCLPGAPGSCGTQGPCMPASILGLGTCDRLVVIGDDAGLGRQ